MQDNIKLFISDSHDSSFNLSVEECIFTQMDPHQTVLFLWRNDKTVVIGRAQNPWKECNLKKMEQDNVILSRRKSGGGAVYQDLGNSCFTFMAGKSSFDKKASAQLIIEATKKLGIDIEMTVRNDLIVNTTDGARKVSGSAYRETFDRGFYHGTMLLNVDLNNLEAYLKPNEKKLETKGIESVRSRVMNLSEINPDINHKMFCNSVIETFFNHYGERVEAEHISPDNMPDLPNFKELFATQRSWEWNFGHTPEFNHTLEERFSWGGVELQLNVVKATISDVRMFTDSSDPAPIKAIADLLPGIHYNPESIDQIFESLILSDEKRKQVGELRRWLVQAVR